MKTTLVTGATGLIGFNVVQSLLKRKRKVRALVRSIDKGKKLLPAEVELFEGDLLNNDSLLEAMKDCQSVYHVAGYPEQWKKDASIFDLVNFQGTINMVETAENLQVEKFIYTSTIDVFEGEKGKHYNEKIIDQKTKKTIYERSKQKAFHYMVKKIKQGFPAINVHPAALYGPGPSDSPGLNDFFIELKNGKVPMLLPGGLPIVYAEDAGEGYVLAEEGGEIGESYIFCDDYYSITTIANQFLSAMEINRKPPPVMPLPIVKFVSMAGELISKITAKPPLIPKGQLVFLQWGAIPDSSKAIVELGWKSTRLTEGIRKFIKINKI